MVRAFRMVAPLFLGASAGCGLILGLDDFEDQRPPDGGVDAGGCGTPADCPSGEHGTATCDGGACGFACEDGFADCDDAPGCETATTADKENCGGCGVTCAAYCEASSCNDPVWIRAGWEHTCAVLEDGGVWCWGSNEDGQLGDGTTQDSAVPRRVMLSEAAIQVAAGGLVVQGGGGMPASHSCALIANRTVMCWGANAFGQLGIGTTTTRSAPVPVPVLERIQDIAAGGLHTCALQTGGTLLCWGYAANGQVGTGIVPSVVSPAIVTSSVMHVAAGGRHTCAVTTAQALLCWGSNLTGQLGIGAQGDQGFPTLVQGFTETVAAAAGGTHTCARRSVGVSCWGSSTFGQLGLGDTVGHDQPQPLDLAGIDALDLGFWHSSAIVGGEVYTWGANGEGQLGDGTAADRPSPNKLDLVDVKSTALGFQHSCALTNAGVITCWGTNTRGQLGDGTTVSRGVPTRVVWP